MFTANCHCGAITLQTTQSPKSITSCNCSICHRIGALWGYYAANDVSLKRTSEQSSYTWNKKQLTFHTCKTCGCTTHYTANFNGVDTIAINTRMAAIAETKDIPSRYFDGADTWEYLNE